MSNTIKKALKRKKKAKIAKSMKQKKIDLENSFVRADPKIIGLVGELANLAKVPLSELDKPLPGTYRYNSDGMIRVISVSDRGEDDDFTVDFCEVDPSSGSDSPEIESKSAYGWASFELMCNLEPLDLN